MATKPNDPTIESSPDELKLEIATLREKATRLEQYSEKLLTDIKARDKAIDELERKIAAIEELNIAVDGDHAPIPLTRLIDRYNEPTLELFGVRTSDTRVEVVRAVELSSVVGWSEGLLQGIVESAKNDLMTRIPYNKLPPFDPSKARVVIHTVVESYDGPAEQF